ncbi:MAG: HAMP domain-containing protein [Spirochaetales bacterium]|nr:HAMP domain-containing protein [Spirochaetales bacterium]
MNVAGAGFAPSPRGRGAKGDARTPRRGRTRVAYLIFALDILLVFLPVASFLLLDTYERGLLDSLEQSLAQQARLCAAWLGGSPLDAASARDMIDAIGDRRTARYRVVDPEGRLLADSSGPPEEAADTPGAKPGSLSSTYVVSRSLEVSVDGGASPVEAAGATDGSPGVDPAANETFLYQLLSTPARLWRRYFAPPRPAFGSADFYSGKTVLDGVEIRAALEGRYGSATRVSSGGQVSVTLYSAVPVLREGRPAGVVLVSQSTWRILSELYALRLDAGRVFLWSLVAAGLISLLLAFVLIAPVERLRRAAVTALDARADPASAFPDFRRRDEFGDLARAFRALLERLEDRMRRTEAFAADVSHEFRNPLAAIRSSAELAESASSAADRSRFHASIVAETERLSSLALGLRRISAAEAPGGERERLELGAACRAVCARNPALALSGEGDGEDAACRPAGRSAIPCRIEGPAGLAVAMEASRLGSMLGNLVDNAASFARSEVVVSFGSRDGAPAARFVEIRVEDDGPGIAAGNLERVFERFFSWRPDGGGEPGRAGGSAERHAGLGLSLAKALAEAEGGTLRAENRDEGGARFVLLLPAA